MSNYKLTRRTILQMAVGASSAILTSRYSAFAKQSNTAKFQNPLFNGDFPDATIVRVGGDFYATHSCDRYAPQLIVWHSQDLVNWMPISVVLDHTYGGVWSPNLTHYQGEFYLYFPLNGSIFVVHATDPAGPWSAPIDLHYGEIDPGHIVGPDGTRYLFSAGGHIIQLAADGLSTVGDAKKVYDGWQFPSDWATEGFWLEGPALLQRGQYYYLISAEGGTSGPPTSHMAVAARSTSPLGPWENSPYNPIIHTYSASEQWWSVGHGTLISTPDDRWYIVYHGYRNGFQTLGRDTLMEPIQWTADGWPVASLGSRRGEPMPAPMGIAQRPAIPLSDDFKGSALRVTWRAWDEPDMGRFQVNNGSLTVVAKGDVAGHSSPLTVSARDTSYAAQVTATPQSGSGAAFGLFYNPDNWAFIELRSGTLKLYTGQATLASQAWSADSVQMKIVNTNNLVDFLVSENGNDWQTLITGFDGSNYKTNVLHGFLSLRPALASSGSGTARFNDFKYNAS